MSKSGVYSIGAAGADVLTLTGDDAVVISPTILGNITLAGGNNITTSGLLNTITISLDNFTDHGVLIGQGANPVVATAVGLTAQVLKGNTGADPSWGAVDLTTDVTGYLPVGSGGTGVGSITAHALVVGDTTDPLNEIAVGATGTVLQGNTGADPAWSTATYPSTVAIGTILISSAANTITTLAPNTAGYVLTDGGAGVAPSWVAPTVGTVTSVAGGTNITASGTAADPIIDLDATITLTTVNATTFDTNVAAAGVTLSGTTLAADGTDANIGITLTPKGTGDVTITSGDVDLTSGNLVLPITTSSIGQIVMNGNPVLHFLDGSGIAAYNNIFLGYNAGNFTNGSEMAIAIGTGSLSSLTSGGASNAIGVSSLQSLTTGGHNNALGYNALSSLITGSHNLALGSSAAQAYTGAESSNLIIFNDGVVGESHTIRIGTQGAGDSQQNKCFIAGIYNTAPTGGADNVVVIDSDGQLGAQASLDVANGGTGVGSVTAHALVVGDTTDPLNEIAVGTTGTILQGNTGADPSWSTATYPSTAAQGDLICASAADTFTVLSAGTATYVLTANGAGAAPTWQAAASPLISINAQTGTTYTLVLTDVNKMITCSNAAAITLTVPPHSSVAFENGTQIIVAQKGAGTVTFAEGAAVTINSADGLLDTYTQYSVVSLIQTEEDVWYLMGDLG